MQLVRRLLPAGTDEDRYRGLLAAQDYLLSLGITGWQDAIIGSGFGEDDADQRLPAGGERGDAARRTWSARCGGSAHEGLEQLAELLHRRGQRRRRAVPRRPA